MKIPFSSGISVDLICRMVLDIIGISKLTAIISEPKGGTFITTIKKIIFDKGATVQYGFSL